MKYFITTPIYYVNDKPHIGHIYTTIAADVLARWRRKNGAEVLFATGTDENAQKNVEAAKEAGKDIQVYVDEMAAIWENTFKKLGFTHDVFVRTTSTQHKRAVEVLLAKIQENDDVYLGEYEGWYCESCEEFIAESELVGGKCSIHNKAPKKIKEKNYFFKLEKYREKLLKYYKAHKDFVRPESARNKMLYYIENEMEDVSISRQAQEWGIRLPQDETHAVYVWFDALINYLTVTGYPDNKEKFAKFWPADVHLIGKDIIKFHCAIWPAMLMSAGMELPKQVFAHGFFTVDGEKISKSLGNAIDPLELIEEYPFDAVRYYLLREIPFGDDGDFSHENLKTRYNADLANGLGNLVSRTLDMMEKYYSDFDGNIEKDKYFEDQVGQYFDNVDKHIKSLAFHKALAEISIMIKLADGWIARTEAWILHKEGKFEETKRVLGLSYHVLTKINEKIAPFMPDTHDKLTELLEARPIKKPVEPLFARKE